MEFKPLKRRYPKYYPKNFSMIIAHHDNTCSIFFTDKGNAIHYDYKTFKKVRRKLFDGDRTKLQIDPDYYKTFFNLK